MALVAFNGQKVFLPLPNKSKESGMSDRDLAGTGLPTEGSFDGAQSSIGIRGCY